MLTVDQIVRIITDNPGDFRAAAEKIHLLCAPDHTIHVAAAALEGEVTSTLLDMTVATVLAKLIDQEGGGRTNFSFSPMDMAAVMKEWSYTVEHDGMVRTVRIQPQNPEEWEGGNGDVLAHSALARSMVRAGESDSEIAPPAIDDLDTISPQADPHEYNRPLWAIAVIDEDGTKLMNCHDRADAGRQYRKLPRATVAHIENRWCLHPECPSTGCNHDATKRDGAEATSA